MAKVSFNVSYWKQSTGLTGQNLSEANQRKFTRVATKYNKRTDKELSKRPHEIDMGAFNVTNIVDLASKPVGRKRKSA